MAEDGSGFIWISSGGGVQRFDGRNFHHIPVTTGSKGIPDDRYVRFIKLKDGRLWLSHQLGISEYDPGTNQFRTITKTSKDPESQLIPFAEDEKGIWCWISGKGLHKLDKTANSFLESITSKYQAIFTITAGTPIYTGQYFIQYTSEAILITDHKTQTPKLISSANKGYYFALEKYKSDTILIATARGIEKLDCKTGTSTFIFPYKTNPMLVNQLHPVQLKLVSPSTCLVSEANKIFELDLQKGTYISGLSNLQNQDFIEIGYVTGLFQDCHSNLWVISENDGIRKVNYRTAGFRYFGTPVRKSNYVKSIYTDKSDNRVLCGTFGEGLLVFDTAQQLLKEIKTFPGTKGPLTVCGFIRKAPHQYIVLVMSSWHMYLLNTEDYSVRQLPVNIDGISGQVSRFLLPDYHLSTYSINDSVSILQTGYRINKLLWKNGKMIVTELDTLSQASVSSSLLFNNQLWIGSYGRYYISKTGFTDFRQIVLPENKLVRCFAASTNNRVWMGTEKGLYWLDSTGKTIRVIGKADGLPDENIYAMQLDNRNNLWLSHNKGISCRKPDGSFLHFSRNDGLQENEFNTNTSFETADGELFFGGVNGISSFYPDEVTAVKETPLVLITGIKIKDVEWKADTAYWKVREIELPYNSNHIAFDLAAIGNRTPDQYNYQYQVSGQEAEWINAGNNSQVRLVLQPGKYMFRYYAGNSFERNPTQVKEVVLIIRPPFWRTPWFITMVAIVLVLCIVLITRYISQVKLRKKVGELEQKKALYEERIRISREMHDDIGAGLTQITLMSERAKVNTASEESLSEIADASRKLVGSMNEIIWSLNPENNTLEQLLAYLREQLNKLLEYSGIDYSIRFPENGSHIVLNNSQRRNILLVTKEIVHNTIKHSRAKTVLVECSYAGDQLQFTIIDDGRGFDTSAKGTGHGLRNIRRRIEELDGSLEISSSTTGGSRFSYTISLS
jgi:signal transduction histidine kinase/ligand-binding sensor domain-containing protein